MRDKITYTNLHYAIIEHFFIYNFRQENVRVAKALSTHPTLISRYRKGTRKPSFKTACKIALFLGKTDLKEMVKLFDASESSFEYRHQKWVKNYGK